MSNLKKYPIVYYSNKCIIVAFIRRNMNKLRRPSILGEEIEYSREIKQVPMDEKLNWNAHLKRATKIARISFWTCRSMMVMGNESVRI